MSETTANVSTKIDPGISTDYNEFEFNKLTRTSQLVSKDKRYTFWGRDKSNDPVTSGDHLRTKLGMKFDKTRAYNLQNAITNPVQYTALKWAHLDAQMADGGTINRYYNEKLAQLRNIGLDKKEADAKALEIANILRKIEIDLFELEYPVPEKAGVPVAQGKNL